MPRAGLADEALAKILSPHGARSKGKLGGLGIHVVEVPGGAAEDAIAEALSHNPHIKFAEPDRYIPPDLYANDAYYGSEWHLQAIQAPAAWDLSSGRGVTVAIIDTGVNGNHPDLQGKMVAGWNFWDNNSDTSDVYGHGTLVAGVVGATSNNGTGVTSVAWDAKLMPIRISDATGYGSWSAMASALNWAADHGAKVANISYMVQASSSVQAAAQYMKNKGGVVFNSAGNTGAYDATAASDALVSVSATDGGDGRSSWSTWGSYVDISAPGVGIWSTDAAGGYSAVSGTSFSSPIAAGVAALMLAANLSLTPASVVSILKATAVDLGDPGYDPYFGSGRINAAAAVQAALQARTPDSQAPTVSITSPLAGQVTGIVPVDVSAADNVGVTRVDLLVNGVLVTSDTTTPFAFSWDSASMAAGSATLVARAFDAAGNHTDSRGVLLSALPVVTGPDTLAPVVKINSPVDGSRVSGQVTINTTATDNIAVTSLQIAVDGVVVSTGNVSPMSYKWNSAKIASGKHTLTATARDSAGNTATTSVTITK